MVVSGAFLGVMTGVCGTCGDECSGVGGGWWDEVPHRTPIDVMTVASGGTKCGWRVVGEWR